jgi:hypothetical protein
MRRREFIAALGGDDGYELHAGRRLLDLQTMSTWLECTRNYSRDLVVHSGMSGHSTSPQAPRAWPDTPTERSLTAALIFFGH